MFDAVDTRQNWIMTLASKRHVLQARVVDVEDMAPVDRVERHEEEAEEAVHSCASAQRLKQRQERAQHATMRAARAMILGTCCMFKFMMHAHPGSSTSLLPAIAPYRDKIQTCHMG